MVPHYFASSLVLSLGLVPQYIASSLVLSLGLGLGSSLDLGLILGLGLGLTTKGSYYLVSIIFLYGNMSNFNKFKTNSFCIVVLITSEVLLQLKELKC